jgi:hypothetical protein
LTKIRSLQTLTLRDSHCSLRDASALLKSGRENRPDLQEWQRTAEDKFNLTKLQTSSKVDGELILSEPHLREIAIPFFPDLYLPTDRLARPLRITLNVDGLDRIPSELVLLVPFVHSLVLDLDEDQNTPTDLSPLPLSNLRSLEINGTTIESVSRALTQSKPIFLASLELRNPIGEFESLALALLECPALTNLVITEDDDLEREVLPVVQMLHRLPLTKLTLDLCTFSDEAIECLLSLTALQDLKLGALTPKQLQLVADALPSLSSLQDLELNTAGFSRCEHEPAHLALFSSLTSSSIRSLSLSHCSFRLAVFEACMDKIPNTQLTQFLLEGDVYADGFDPSLHNSSYPRVQSKDLRLGWHLRFPEAKDRFCLLKISV